MSPNEIYEKRVRKFRAEADNLQRKENRLSFARLISFFSGFILFVLLFSISATVAVIALTAGLLAFGWFVEHHLKTVRRKDFYRHLETINSLELKCLEGDFSGYPDGMEYTDMNHANSFDLDLFGHASLFQFINRTTSRPAADKLAEWLKAPTTVEEIRRRQKSITDIRSRIDWRQQLIENGYKNKQSENDPESLLRWIKSADLFTKRSSLKITTYTLSAIGLITTIMVILGLPVALLTPVIIINFLYYFTQGKKISKLHEQVSRSSEILKSYSETIKLIENENFESEMLLELQKSFRGEIPASCIIKKLSGLVNKLDTRLNVLVSIPLNLFFFWDIHYCLALEKWKGKHAALIPEWFAAMAEFETVSSFSNMSFNNPEWVMPEIASDYFVLKAGNLGHPLIPEGRRICNSVELTGKGRTMVVTGSNMSGKSTFLRTCGVNTVLALAGSPVCASSFTVSHVNVWSSMRISDSLEDNTSSFYAELKRLAAIIEKAKNDPEVFLLLDEILRGTNSNDRYTGSVALIKQLQEYDAVTIIATHDLKLADMAENLPGKIDNYHFDVKINGEELFFDYKLTPGICTSLNASILMKKMGIKV